ncbi:MAG: hypothetical protein ACE5J2_01785 [Nitrososphaerales archaeon]
MVALPCIKKADITAGISGKFMIGVSVANTVDPVVRSYANVQDAAILRL